MGELNMTYDDVVFRIPYRNLVIMQKDKLHISSGEVMREVCEDEFFKNRKNKLKN